MLICPHCESGEVRKRGTRGEDPVKQIIQCKACGQYSQHAIQETKSETILRDPADLKKISSAKVWIISSVQNNTPLRETFMGALLAFAKQRNAELILARTRYRNPTNQTEADREDAESWWPTAAEPYLLEEELTLTVDTAMMGHVRVGATAVNPLTGLEPLMKGRHAIFAHAQIAMKTVPAPQYAHPQEMWTTGSASVKNYSDTKAGVKAEFHHSNGAVIVERSTQGTFIRGVVADDTGGFYDLDTYYGPGTATKPGKVKTGQKALALVTGDEHAIFMTDAVKKATYTAPDSLANIVRPLHRVRHDVLDSYAISHHHRQNTVTRYVKWKTGMDSMEAELQHTADFITETSGDSINVIVASNHHDHLMRWLNEADPKQEPWNAILYHELMAAVLRAAEMTPSGAKSIDPFAHWAKDKVPEGTVWLSRNESYPIAGVEVSLHGDRGANGSRGGIKGFAKLGIRTVIGHSHSSGIEKGCYQVGASEEELEYSSGPGSWTITHCIIHPNGKRQLVTLKNGRFRA